MNGVTATAALSGGDQRILARVAVLLDQVARSTNRAAVTLHVAAALHCLPAVATEYSPAPSNEREALRAALRLLAELPADALRVEAIADAANHTLLAYLATR